MKKTAFISILLIFFLSFNKSTAITATDLRESLNGILTPDRLIAHACGEYNGLTYTNSINAIDKSYKNGFRMIEVDLNLTSDKRIVLLHDWSSTSRNLLGISGFTTYRVFKNTKPKYDLQLMDIEALTSWMKAHKDSRIIIDCKNNELYILDYIRKNHIKLLDNFIVETTNTAHLSKIKKMGFKKIILMIKRCNNLDEDIIRCITQNNLFAVSMDYKSAKSDLPEKLKIQGIRVYAYTINSVYRYDKLSQNGVYGVFTDYIVKI